MAIAPLQLPGQFQSQTLDFSPLANLGKVYEQAQAKRGLQEALAGGVDPNNPQSLSQLAAKVLPYDSTMGLSLAQLGNTAQNRQQDMVWRQQEAMRAQQNADRSFGFQRDESARAQTNADRNFGVTERTADRLDSTAEEASPSGRAKIAPQYGLTPGTPEHKSFVLTGKLPESNTTVEAQTQQRQQAAQRTGLTPDNPGYQSYILTGKMPREDAQPLTATDKKAIMEADEGVLSARSALDSIARAKDLSKKAFEGPTASGRGYIASFLGEGSDIGKAGIATTQLDNEVTSNALSQLKAIFGGAPTEGERKILLDIQGAARLPDDVRQKIFDRAGLLAQARLKFNEQRASELRGGQFYKPQGSMTRAPAAQTQGITQQQYEALPSGSPFTAPDGSQRVKP